eukprot:IDg17962t1
MMEQQQRGGTGSASAGRSTLAFTSPSEGGEDSAVAHTANALAEASIGESHASDMSGVTHKSQVHGSRIANAASSSGNSAGMRKPQRHGFGMAPLRGGRVGHDAVTAEEIVMGAQLSSKHLDDINSRVDSALVDKVDKELFNDPPTSMDANGRQSKGMLTMSTSGGLA